MKTGRPPKGHGTESWYRRQGCRCEACVTGYRTARREQMRRYRKERAWKRLQAMRAHLEERYQI